MSGTKQIHAQRSPDDLSRLIHAIYGAAASPRDWPSVVEDIARSFDATKGLLFTPFLGPQDGGFVFSWGFSASELELWATRYITHDIWSIRARERGLWIEGAAYIGDDMVEHDEFRASLIYREYLSQIDIAWICGGIVFEAGPALPLTSTSYFRGPDAPPFDAQDRAWAKLLLPHLSRSLGLMHRLNALEVRLASMHDTLDRLAFGVALLNADLEVLHLNTAARNVFERNDGLWLNARRLIEGRGSTNHKLLDWLAASTSAGAADSTHFSSGFVVSRSKAGSNYLLQYSVLDKSADWHASGEAVRYVLFITDPTAFRLPPATRLRSLYSLTAAEARVTRELAMGKSQKEVASSLRISAPTARTHTQRVFEKMRLNRHADLVRTVLSLGEVAV